MNTPKLDRFLLLLCIVYLCLKVRHEIKVFKTTKTHNSEFMGGNIILFIVILLVLCLLYIHSKGRGKGLEWKGWVWGLEVVAVWSV